MENVLAHRQLLADQVHVLQHMPLQNRQGAAYLKILQKLSSSLSSGSVSSSHSNAPLSAPLFLAAKDQFRGIPLNAADDDNGLDAYSAAHDLVGIIYQEMVTSGTYLFARLDLDLGLGTLVPLASRRKPQVCNPTMVAAGIRAARRELVWPLAATVSCADVSAVDPLALSVLADEHQRTAQLLQAIATGAVSVADAWDAALALESAIVV
jgi:hypothetical protein